MKPTADSARARITSNLITKGRITRSFWIVGVCLFVCWFFTPYKAMGWWFVPFIIIITVVWIMLFIHRLRMKDERLAASPNS